MWQTNRTGSVCRARPTMSSVSNRKFVGAKTEPTCQTAYMTVSRSGQFGAWVNTTGPGRTPSRCGATTSA